MVALIELLNWKILKGTKALREVVYDEVLNWILYERNLFM
jgi:hypothetical protein